MGFGGEKRGSRTADPRLLFRGVGFRAQPYPREGT